MFSHLIQHSDSSNSYRSFLSSSPIGILSTIEIFSIAWSSVCHKQCLGVVVCEECSSGVAIVEGLLYSFPHWTQFLGVANFHTVVADKVIAAVVWALGRFQGLATVFGRMVAHVAVDTV